MDFCGDLMHLSHFMYWRTSDATKNIDDSLRVLRKKGQHDQIGSATCLAIVNLFHKGSYITREPSVVRETSGENVSRLASEMQRRFNAYTLVALHEILEDYLCAAFGKMLYQLRNEETIPDKQAFHNVLKSEAAWTILCRGVR